MPTEKYQFTNQQFVLSAFFRIKNYKGGLPINPWRGRFLIAVVNRRRAMYSRGIAAAAPGRPIAIIHPQRGTYYLINRAMMRSGMRNGNG